MGRCSAEHEGVDQLRGHVEAGGALPQWCCVDEVRKRSAHACRRATKGVWTGAVRVVVRARVRVRVSDGVWAGARGRAMGGHLVRSPWVQLGVFKVC